MSLMARNKGTVTEEKSMATATAQAGEGLNAILDKGTTFEGKLVFEGTVHINGVFTGDVVSKDTLIIGAGAKVQGTIDVGHLIINGEVSGHIRARESLVMHAPARVKGEVTTPMLQIDRGVVFDGTTKMESASDAGTRPAQAAVAKA